MSYVATIFPKKYSYPEIEMKVIQWAEARRIIQRATPVSQLMKLVSELGELCDAEGKQDMPEVRDAVGDVMVCLINYCAIKGIDLTQCLNGAYEEIKDRKGTLMEDGTFVKEVA
jgi:NTP pyrophosphatase (non-canonical NTP hydrolase)